MSNIVMNRFAAVHSGVVFGIGSTKEEALKDSEKWTDMVKYLSVVPCTEAAYQRIEENGWCSGISVYRDGVMLETEEE